MELHRRRPAATGRRLAIGLALAGTALTGCDTVTACPAIGYAHTLTVALAEGWPAGTGRTVHLDCSPACGVEWLEDGTMSAQTSAPLAGTSASVPFSITPPDSVVVRVLDATGAELTRFGADPEWRRVGGTAECGGPSEATVTVPAP